MRFVPGFLEGYREQIHKHADAVAEKFNRWDKTGQECIGELEAPALLAALEVSMQPFPQTWERQAAVYAGHVVCDGWTRRDIPPEFHAEVSRLVSAMR